MNPTQRLSAILTSGWTRFFAVVLVIGILVSRAIPLPAAAGDYNIAQTPLYLAQTQAPLMMLVMSRDEQLFNKAYSDYTDLDGDGRLDTTYQDEFDYSGYFDPKLCYGYSGGHFEASGKAGGSHEHSCGGNWSGNFLNWVTMSRLDVLRFVLYGGKRSGTPNNGALLERAHIPNDLHAWVKVYSGSDIGSFTPFSSTTSFCNASIGVNGEPIMRVASGNYSEWAATALSQCLTYDDTNNSQTRNDIPSKATNYTVKVNVCASSDESNRESFCREYVDGTNRVYRPAGLLQEYGESGKLRFGLVSGSYSQPRSGGVLRRNIGLFAGNSTPGTCVDGDEVNLQTGQFCNQGSGNEGIINTIDRFKLTQWGGSNWNDCNNYSILNRQGFGYQNLDNPGSNSWSQKCSGWGNPLTEMYAEALRYIAGETKASPAFVGGNDLSGLPTNVTWNDPYRTSDGGNSYCATCSILLLSSGLPSFDSDEIPGVPQLPNANSATNDLGSKEGIAGNYFAGRIGATPLGESLNTHEDTCKSWTVTALGDVRGICPDSPSVEGSYLISGLAYKAFTTDLRPGLQDKPEDWKNVVRTYSVALAENLPKFDIPVGAGTITLSPLCQANNSGSATANSGGWRTCFLGSVGIGSKQSSVNPKNIYGRDLKYVDGKLVAGSYSLVWEDSLWGNDHDNDVVAMLSFCVGDACNDRTNPVAGYSGKDICWNSNSSICDGGGSPTVGAGEVLVRIENLSAYAGNAMLSGFTVTGSNSDGTYREALRPGNSDGSLLTRVGNPGAGDSESKWSKPKVYRFSAGSGDTKLLESPLWYAAKYGNFDDINKNGVPDPGEWDKKTSGTPDAYFLARDPRELKKRLGEIFAEAAGSNETVSGGGAGARISTDSFTLSASYSVPTDSNDWIGDVVAHRVTSSGAEGAELWKAASQLSTVARRIYMTTSPTHLDNDELVAVKAAAFSVANLPGTTDAQRVASLGLDHIPAWFGPITPDRVQQLVDYLGGTPVADFRQRSSLLGDIVNSSPEVVSPRDDYGYGMWASYGSVTWKKTLGDRYKTYLEDKASGSASPVVYVGANDGMLHAFDASATTAGGKELFAFIPAAARSHMAELANPDYVHRYYVDGLVTPSDVYYGSSWHTVLVGSTGAGGASQAPSANSAGHGAVFGLDITSPSSFDQDDVLWELSGANDTDLGFVLGKPVVVPVTTASGTPRFVALFGNGVNSGSGAPVLFVVDVATGEVLRKLKPSNDYASRNGLMNLAGVATRNHDGVVDTVYGGDLQGNLWKFDLSDANPANWNVAYSGTPLFQASRDGVAQPITGEIEVSSGPGGGVSIFFGTGRYFAEEDKAAGPGSPIQSLYGIWDNGSSVISGRSELVGQVITASVTSNGYQTRNVSSNAVSYVSKRGWYVDLAVSPATGGLLANGERFFGTPRIQNGKVFFTTFTPGEATCSGGGGVNWLYGLSLLTGAGSMSGVTIGADGVSVCTGDCGAIALNNGDSTAPPAKDTSIFVPKLTPCDPATDSTCTVDKLIAAEQCTFVLRAPGAEPLNMPRPCGRQSWRQVR